MQIRPLVSTSTLHFHRSHARTRGTTLILAGPRIYTGYIDYLPFDSADPLDPLPTETTIAHIHRHLLPLDEPIPIGTADCQWRRIEGPFTHVLITSKSAIAKETISTPQSTLTDGYLTLQFIRSSDSVRMQLAKAFTSLSDGTHLNYDFVESMPVRAFRIVPSETNGNIMIDGEKVPYGKQTLRCLIASTFFSGPIQGEVLPSIARCMGKAPRTDA